MILSEKKRDGLKYSLSQEKYQIIFLDNLHPWSEQLPDECRKKT